MKDTTSPQGKEDLLTKLSQIRIIVNDIFPATKEVDLLIISVSPAISRIVPQYSLTNLISKFLSPVINMQLRELIDPLIIN